MLKTTQKLIKKLVFKMGFLLELMTDLAILSLFGLVEH